MYPTTDLLRTLEKDATLIYRVWEKLNRIAPADLLGESRVYGGGLHKLEPRELGNVDATFLADLIPQISARKKAKQLGLFDNAAELSANNALEYGRLAEHH